MRYACLAYLRCERAEIHPLVPTLPAPADIYPVVQVHKAQLTGAVRQKSVLFVARDPSTSAAARVAVGDCFGRGPVFASVFALFERLHGGFRR